MIDLQTIQPEIEAIITKLQLPLFSKKDMNLTYRALNHYQNKGIIQDSRSNTKLWRKFNSIDYIWIWIITQLRLLGVRLEDIKVLETKIFIEGKLGYIDKANFISRSFSHEIAYSIHGNYKLYLIIFSDFTFTFHDSLSLNQWVNKSYKDEVHISIPLKQPIKDAWRLIKNEEETES